MFAKIQSAAERLQGQAHKTPVATSSTLDGMLGAKIFLKCENLQRVGAFKFRGAYNAISRLTEDERQRGVLAYSSGNHAQAVALVGKLLGVPATVVMPSNAPSVKRQATENYGARVIEYDPEEGSREDIAADFARDGQTIIPPYDHEHIIAGQGTAALELLGEVSGLDALIVPCGGGGLLSGSAVAAKSLAPGCRVIGVEPETADDATRSFRTGRLVAVHNPKTIADGTRTPSLGKLTFPLVLRYVDEMATVSEESIAEAVRFLLYRCKLVVEPSGALGVAALMSGSVAANGRIGVILSGGNIDSRTLTAILAS